MNIAEVLSMRARSMGNAIAIRDVHRGKDRTITFAELERQSAQAATLFVSRGLKTGDGVLVLHGMSIELYAVLIGIFRAGLIAMFLDPSAGRAHIQRCCELQAPQGFIGGPKAHLLRFTSAALRQIPHSFVIGPWMPGAVSLSSSEQFEPAKTVAAANASTPALLTFTSGSTGQPKAAVRTHAFLLAQHRALERSIALREGEVDLTTLPVFVLANLGSGVTSIIPNADLRRSGFIEAQPVLDQIKKFKPTRSAGSPSFYECLLEQLEASSANCEGLPALKIYTGGAPVFPRLLLRLKSCFRENPEAVYGSTEAEPISHLDYGEITAADFAAMQGGKGLLAGLPVSEIQLRIIEDRWGKPLGNLPREKFDRLIQPTDIPGEIVVSGGHVLTTYLHGKGNQETKFTVDDAIWHRTGDLGYLDEQGHLWLLGRCVAKINDSRGSLFPFAVECAAHQFDWVRFAGCVGAHGKRWLALQVRRSPTEAEFQDLRDSLKWAKLDDYRLLKNMPVDKRHNAKIDYTALKQDLLQG